VDLVTLDLPSGQNVWLGSTIPTCSQASGIYRLNNKGQENVKVCSAVVEVHGGKLLAVRRVTQDNRQEDAGIDGIACLDPDERFAAGPRPEPGRQAQPVRRSGYPSPAQREEDLWASPRCPTAQPKPWQVGSGAAKEEARFEPNSYGFPTGTVCHMP